MKKIFLFAVLFSCIAGAQTFQWLQTPAIDLNSNPSDIGYSVATDPSGNVYLTGFKDTPFHYNDLMGHLLYNKYDSSGQLLFSKQIGGRACNHNLVADSQGNMLIALGYVGTITIDDVTITTTEQGDHFVLAKLSPQGNLLWHRLIISSEESTWTNEFSAITIDAQDNIYIGYDTFGTSFIDKHSPDGEKIMGIVQEHANSLTSIAVDTEGNIYAAGSCADNMATFGGVVVPTNFAYSNFIVKYSPEGAYQWLKYVESITCPDTKVVARTPNEVYFSSSLFGAYAFDGITTEGPAGNAFEDIFLAKLDGAGNYQWVREVPGEGKVVPGKRNSLAMDDDGNVYFTGNTRGNIDWGSGVTSETPSMDADILILKYSPEGTVLMAKTAGGDGYDNADGITINSSGDAYIAGMGNGHITFDSHGHDAGQFDNYPFLAKLNTETMGTNNPEVTGIVLYPNPATDSIYISGLNEYKEGAILNMLGQEIAAFTSDGTTPIAVHQLPAGTYFIKAEGYPALKFIKN